MIRRIARRHGVPVLGLAVVATAWSLVNLRDLLDQWSTAVPTRLDNRFQAWVIHWVQGALMGEHALFDAATFAPAPDSLTFSDHLIGLAVVLLPLRGLGMSPAAIFNTGLVLGVVADAVAAYLMGFVLTRRRSAGLVAAAVFALGPVPWLATMHINLVWRAGLPLIVAAVWVLADRASQRDEWESVPADRVLLAGLALVIAWQGLLSFFYAVFVLILAVLVVAVRWRDVRSRLVPVGLAVGLGAAAFVPSYVPYLGTRSRYPDYRFDLDDIAFLRAAPHIVEDSNLLWGGTLGRPLFGPDGFHAFPGVTVLLLVGAGLAATAAWRRRHGWAVPALGLVVTVVGALGAIGPGEGAWRGWTPYAIAFRFVPGFSAIRASGRFVLLVLVGLAVLAALAVGTALDRWEDRSRVGAERGRPGRPGWLVGAVGAGLVIAAIGGEGLNGGRDVTAAAVHPIDEVVAAQDEPGGVVYLPDAYAGLGDFDAQEEFVLRSSAHDRPIANGFAGYYPPSAFALGERLESLPDDGALDCLARYDIRFVVVTERVALTPWAALADPAAARPLELVVEAAGERLYRVPDRSVAPDACPLSG
ncbi:MAG TPA: hypothetical protein VFU19_12385 [Iamia sp.]|nr:hypothetical protein [Iamia sp.]